ncbi:DNA methyltransferase, partial [Escherichia coli]
MSRFVLGNCIDVMTRIPDNAIDFILTDPPYLVGFRDRSGRTIAGDKTDEWLQPACNEMYRVLKKDALMVSFYGWNRVDRFIAAWKNAGFSVVGHLVFTKNYTSKAAYVGYRHECAYILAKGRPRLPQNPPPDVLGWKYSGNRHHPTEKPVTSLQPLIESFTHPNAIVLDPFAGSGSTCVAAL